MTDVAPQEFLWTDEGVMRPLNPRAADRQYCVGERYRLVPYEERTTATHNHEFAWLAEAWRNLPEQFADAYPSPEHLRKRALIEAGYYREEIIDAGSNAAAIRVAGFARRQDDFAMVFVRSRNVFIRTAKSQSRRAMNKAEFQASKSAILDIVANMLGLTPAQLRSAA